MHSCTCKMKLFAQIFLFSCDTLDISVFPYVYINSMLCKYNMGIALLINVKTQLLDTLTLPGTIRHRFWTIPPLTEIVYSSMHI